MRVDPLDGNVFVSESGVQLKIKSVNSFLMLQAQAQVEMPKVPVVWLEDKGREEENPNDPSYLQAVQDANVKKATRITDLFLGYGSEVINPLPDGVPEIADEEWADDLSAMLGIEVPANKRMRYAYWLKAHALNDSEVLEIINIVSSKSGLVREVDVAEASDTFPSDEGRNTDGAVSDTEQSTS